MRTRSQFFSLALEVSRRAVVSGELDDAIATRGDAPRAGETGNWKCNPLRVDYAMCVSIMLV